jgi:hypothetical protein
MGIFGFSISNRMVFWKKSSTSRVEQRTESARKIVETRDRVVVQYFGYFSKASVHEIATRD